MMISVHLKMWVQRLSLWQVQFLCRRCPKTVTTLTRVTCDVSFYRSVTLFKGHSSSLAKFWQFWTSKLKIFQLRTEEAEIAIATAFLRRTFSICAVKGQAFSLLGRLEGLGAGVAAAQGRRSLAAQQENLWRRQRQAHALCVRQGRDILRRGQFHLS